MRICVTGGTGFLGQELVPILQGAGHEVFLIGRQTADRQNIQAIDLLTDDVGPLLNRIRPEAMVHLAWTTKPGQFWHSPDNLDWLAASLRLVRAFASAGGKRLVSAGSCAEYDWDHALLDERDTPLAPHTLYGTAKSSFFQTLVAGSQALGISYACGRIFFPYGGREQPGRLLSSLIDNLSAGQPVAVSSGEQVRDFIHVKDAACAIAALLLSELEGAVNIASGTPITVRSFIASAANMMNGLDLVQFGARPTQPGEPPCMEAGMSRLRGELGFEPRFDLETGLKDAIAGRLALKSIAATPPSD